jgi:serine/threonine protein kinase/tetratricopeptide (TPR) repeat protein
LEPACEEVVMVRDAARVKSIFLAAVERYPAEQWPAYLDGACGEDAELRERVEQLLGAHGGQKHIDFPAPPRPGETVARPAVERPGDRVNPYKLMEQIGEGGMGVVYVAEQTQPVRRKVALKVIKPGMDSRQVVARFEAERQALAMKDHPNIARVYDGGTTASGRPYFVMELVRGVPITEYCDDERLSIRERLELFVLVCRAVQHAHQKGLIHRDLKPSNILVTLHDGVPVPKVIDFGIAKATGHALTDKTVYTAFHQLVGTPLYMSPEQVELSGLDVDTRSDIYSLGVLLYELLTGTTPFDAETLRKAAFDELRRIIREQEPPRPSIRLSSLGATLTTVSARRKADPRRLGPSLRGELDWVVMKALEKDRRRRYETANDFASDVVRYLTDQPVQACPPSAGYRLRKFLRRNKGPVAAGLALAALLLIGTVGTSIGLVWAMRAEAEAKQAESKAKEEAAVAKAVTDFLQNDLLAQAQPYINARTKKVTVEEVLGRAAARIAGKFAQQPLVEAEIRATIGSAYNSLGDYAAAQPHLERGYELSSRILGEEHPRTLTFMNNLAGLYMNQGMFARAEPLMVEAVEVGRRVQGEENPDVITRMNNLAYLYVAEGKLSQVEPLAARALEVARRRWGEESVQALGARAQLAHAYVAQGKPAQGEALVVKDLEVARRRWGDRDFKTLNLMRVLGSLYLSQGQLTEAEPLLVSALEAHRSIEGDNHPHTLESLTMLAELYRLRMRFQDSIPLLEDLLKGTRAMWGDDHPDTLDALSRLGDSYRQVGRVPEGTGLLEQAWAKASKQRGLPVERLTSISGNLGWAYEQAGQIAKAESVYREALETVRPRDKEAPSHSAALQVYLAGTLVEQQRYAEAEPLLRECLKFREQNEANKWWTFATKSQLGGSLLGQKKYVEAEPLLLAGYEGMKQREGTIPPIVRKSRLAKAIERLVQLYEARGKREKAAEWRTKLPPAAELPDDVFARP